MKRYTLVVVFLMIFALLVCGCNVSSYKRAKEKHRLSEVQRDIYEISDNIRFVDVAVVRTHTIYVYVYADYIEYDEEELMEKIIEIADAHDLNEEDHYSVQIQDISARTEKTESSTNLET